MSHDSTSSSDLNHAFSGGIPEKIEKVDLGPIKFKLTHADGENWSREKAEQVEKQYRAFLALRVICPNEPLVPTKDVDKFWHYHILDTRKYMDDCEAMFGSYLHHFPYFGLRGEDDAAALEEGGKKTKRLLALLASARDPETGASSGCGSVVCSVGSCNDGCNTGDIRAEVRPTY